MLDDAGRDDDTYAELNAVPAAHAPRAAPAADGPHDIKIWPADMAEHIKWEDCGTTWDTMQTI